MLLLKRPVGDWKHCTAFHLIPLSSADACTVPFLPPLKKISRNEFPGCC
jgi:hypothetical protein